MGDQRWTNRALQAWVVVIVVVLFAVGLGISPAVATPSVSITAPASFASTEAGSSAEPSPATATMTWGYSSGWAKGLDPLRRDVAGETSESAVIYLYAQPDGDKGCGATAAEAESSAHKGFLDDAGPHTVPAGSYHVRAEWDFSNLPKGNYLLCGYLVFNRANPPSGSLLSEPPAATVMEETRKILWSPLSMSPVADDLSQIYKKGLPLDCGLVNDEETGLERACDKVTAKLTVSKEVARYLGLPSTVIASGVAAGPVTEWIDDQRYFGIHRIKLKSSVIRKMKAKKVLSMSLIGYFEAEAKGHEPSIWANDKNERGPNLTLALANQRTPCGAKQAVRGLHVALNC